MNTAEFLMIASSVVPERMAMIVRGRDEVVRGYAGAREPPG